MLLQLGSRLIERKLPVRLLLISNPCLLLVFRREHRLQFRDAPVVCLQLEVDRILHKVELALDRIYDDMVRLIADCFTLFLVGSSLIA